MLERKPWSCTFLISISMWSALSSMSLVEVTSADVVHTFVDSDVQHLNHLVVDKNTGQVFIGGVNKLYQLTPDLDPLVVEATGPKNDSTGCYLSGCLPGAKKELTNNVNKALVIDYSNSRLISCGSLFQGTCAAMDLWNVSKAVQQIQAAVVANDGNSSTFAFIAPGPPNPPISQVMYVGVSYTGNSPYRSEVPAVSSRSLDKERMLAIAESTVTSGTRIFVSSLSRAQFPVNYVYGFSSGGFSHFLTIQPKDTVPGSEFVSKLVRVCQDDENYYSYTEIPIECANEFEKYNLVQAAYVGKPGSALAEHFGITIQDDVLFAVFSKSNSPTDDKPMAKSALCVYSLKSIRRKFRSNIQNCFAGNGQRGMDFISPSQTCVPLLGAIAEDFCGLDVNTPLEGTDPLATSPALAFDERLTAIVTTSIDDHTIVFIGTSDGHLRKIIVETPTSALKYGEVEVDLNSPVNSDLHFDPESKHLYVMTKRKVSKVKVQGCSGYKTCSECSSVQDPYCGWCSLEDKCNLKSECRNSAPDTFRWIPHGSCAKITSVTPYHLQKTRARTLDLVVENLPTLSGSFFCAFSALGQTLITNATRTFNGVRCPSPNPYHLPSIQQDQHHYTAQLSVRTNAMGPDLATTDFLFFDCKSFSSCTECVSSSYSCHWCIGGYKCTHSTSEECPNDETIAPFIRTDVDYPSRRRSCPAIHAAPDSQEILIPSGSRKALHVKARIFGNFIVLTRFLCQFNIEGHLISVDARLLADTIYCDAIEFSHTSTSPNITIPFAVVWGGSRPLDNPDNIHIVVYRCSEMADDCATCLTLPQKYGCVWCQSSNQCKVKDQCDRESGVWLNRDRTCPDLQIHSFEPETGPWEGGTNVTIRGTNLGKSFTDIETGVTIAALPCHPYPELYVRSKQIVCKLHAPGIPQDRTGPVIVRVEDFRGYSNLSFKFNDPVIESISPKIGPKSGGTLIRITGRYMNTGSRIQAFIDNLPCSITSAKENEAFCITSASDSTRSGIFKMKFDDGTREHNEVFEYKDDPTIISAESGFREELKIPKGIPAGGIRTSVIGTNLRNVQSPQMYAYYGDKMFVSQCTVFSETNMVCYSPIIEAPESVTLDADHPLSLEYGFLMDNVIGVQNLSAQGFNGFLLYPDPIFEEFDEDVKNQMSDYLTIHGHNIDRVCHDSDVTVRIGNSFCNITSLSRNQLTCRLPSSQPLGLNSEGRFSDQELPEVVVIIGDMLRKSIGKLRYVSLTDINQSLQQGDIN